MQSLLLSYVTESAQKYILDFKPDDLRLNLWQGGVFSLPLWFDVCVLVTLIRSGWHTGASSTQHDRHRHMVARQPQHARARRRHVRRPRQGRRRRGACARRRAARGFGAGNRGARALVGAAFATH